MREKFNVTGLYYEIDGFKFRKFLNITKKSSNCMIPDLMVVMMNPGGSKPLNGIDSFDEETEAIADRTQDQIMKIMINCGFKYARVLNLSDLRESKSNLFYSKIIQLEDLGIHHSIFSDSRREEFDEVFIHGVPVIFGWGVNGHLVELADLAIKRIGNCKSFGLKKENVDYAFYHPLPQNYNKQKEWVVMITYKLKAWSSN